MNRIPRLDGLRALAFLAVFLNHAVHLPMAWVGVDLFFVLSGFLITTILRRDRETPPIAYIGHFYARRARRILPPYFIVLGLVALLQLPEIEWEKIWWHFLVFIQNFSVAWGYKTGALTPYWSLAVEEQFYLIWPLVVYVLPQRALTWTCIALIVGAPLLRAYFTPNVDSYTVIFCLTPFRADLLAAGALIAIARDRWNKLLPRIVPTAWVLMCVSAAAFFFPAALTSIWRASAHSVAFNTWGYTLSVAMCAAALIVVLGSRGAWLDVVFGWAPIVRLGRISYMCYLVHEPALHLSWRYFSVWSGAAVAFVATWCFSALSWRFIESRLLQPAGSQR